MAVAAGLAACTRPAEPGTATMVAVFQGYSAPVAPTTASLSLIVGSTSFGWDGDHSVAAGNGRELAEIAGHPDDSVHAIAVVRTAGGQLLAEVRLDRRLQADYYQAIAFQAGGVNPDLRGFCHQSPAKAAIQGFPGDTLFLWWAAQPIGAVC